MLFKDFYNEAKMEKNETNCMNYFVIVPKTIPNRIGWEWLSGCCLFA
jgi:hypothetical protein